MKTLAFVLLLLLVPALSCVGQSLEACPNVPTAPGGGVITPPPSTNNPVVGITSILPIEVLGPDQTVETFPLVLTSGADTVTGLYMQAHNINAQNKVSVRINGGAWKTLNNGNTVQPQLEVATFGMGGITDTMRFTVPLVNGEAINGTNIIDLRFNDVDGFTVGYTVIDISLMSGASRLNPTNQFTFDNPATWVSPLNTPADIEAGRNLWTNAVLVDWFPYENQRKTIWAKCSDCHPRSGRDLAYFNFSPRSIRERSKFHGLTTDQGNQIAAYILSLRTNGVPYVAAARPWNPPYQPGPGLDAKPVYEWAAGAGLGAVVDSELTMIADMFPGGITTNALNFEGAIVNMRQVRHTVQFPTWHRWLPRVHLVDQDVRYLTNRYFTQVATMRAALVGKTPAQAAAYIDGQETVWDGFQTIFPEPQDDDPSHPLWAHNHFARLKFRAVYTWELMHSTGAEDQGHEVFGATSEGGSPINDRTWLHGSVFRIGPHVSKQEKIPTFYLESMQWYQLQLVLNDGLRKNPAIVPIDWGYQHALNISASGNPASRLFYGNAIANIIKGNEVVANGLSVINNDGWNPSKGDTFRVAPKTGKTLYNTIPVDTRRQVAEAILEQWLYHALRYTRDQYAARQNFQFTTLRRASIRDMATECALIGVSNRHINLICDYGQLLFPADDWNPYRP